MQTASDVIYKQDIKSLAQNQAEQTLRFRQAFRDHDGGDAGRSMDFPDIEEADDIDEEEFVEVDGGDPYPEVDFGYTEQTLVYSKYGVALSFDDEDVQDSRIDVTFDGKQQVLTAESRRMDGIAYEIISSSAQTSGVGNDDDDLSTDELIDGRAYHRTNDGGNYDPDLAFVEPLGGASVLKELKERGTAAGDEAARTGKIGDIAGMDIVESNTGRLSPHSAILVDTDLLGWESVKFQKNVEEERIPREDRTEFTIGDRLGWIAVDGDAAAVVNS